MCFGVFPLAASGILGSVEKPDGLSIIDAHYLPATAHRVSEDDEYKGFFIPKGSIILGNTW